MMRLSGFVKASLYALLLVVAQTATAAPINPLLTPTSLSVGAASGDQEQSSVQTGGNVGSASVSYTFSDTVAGNWQGSARGQAGGESSLGAPPFAEGLAHASVSSLDPLFALTAFAGGGGNFLYQMQLTPLRPPPGGNPFAIYFTFTYAGQAKLTGNVGGASTAMSQIILSSSTGGSLLNVGANANPGWLFADYSGSIPVSTGSLFPDVFSVFVSAGTSVTISGNGTVEGEAIADPIFAFDQAAFDADMIAQGRAPFLLADYFDFSYSAGYNAVPEPERAVLVLLSLALLWIYSQRRTAAV